MSKEEAVFFTQSESSDQRTNHIHIYIYIHIHIYIQQMFLSKVIYNKFVCHKREKHDITVDGAKRNIETIVKSSSEDDNCCLST